MSKIQRIRDPLHNLIEFDIDSSLDKHLWKVLQTKPMQRMRRIRQLGFAEYVYPGATHSRFAHSVGVMHTAKIMADILNKQLERGKEETDSKMKNTAIFTALLHDIGHGPFSHVFEHTMKNTKNPFKHEEMTRKLIREHEDLNKVLKDFRGELPKDIDKMLYSVENIYASIISSQFDADRLDYMRRDQLMTGTKHGAIDFQWLIANLDIAKLNILNEDKEFVPYPILALNQKAIPAAETYLLGLLQLYQTVYFHKTVRGAERFFTELIKQIIDCITEAKEIEKYTGLSKSHPLIMFLEDPDNIQNFLAIDDFTILGALPLMKNAKDKIIANFSARLLERKFYKCIDIKLKINEDNKEVWEEECQKIKDRVVGFINGYKNDPAPVLFDSGYRPLYRKLEEKDFEKIYYLKSNRKPEDLADFSKIIQAIKPFCFSRLYYDADNPSAKEFCEKVSNNYCQRQ